jgi:hypothetical protein
MLMHDGRLMTPWTNVGTNVADVGVGIRNAIFQQPFHANG